MKKIVLLLATLICVQVVAGASPYSATTGPYIVTFDLGQKPNEYDINISDPVENEDLSGSKFTNYNIGISRNFSSWLESGSKGSALTFFSIGIVKYPQNAEVTTSEEMEKFLRGLVENKAVNTDIKSSIRTIDYYPGAIVSYGIKQTSYVSAEGEKIDFQPVEAYSAMYQPPFRDTLIFIDTVCPWDEGTLQLLKTIHVTEAK